MLLNCDSVIGRLRTRRAGSGNVGVICELGLKAYSELRCLVGFLIFRLIEIEKVFGGLRRINTTPFEKSVNFLLA